MYVAIATTLSLVSWLCGMTGTITHTHIRTHKHALHSGYQGFIQEGGGTQELWGGGGGGGYPPLI